MSQKRNLPSWITSRDPPQPESKKKPKDADEHNIRIAPESSSTTMDFSKLLEGVVFVLSGFVNPERSTLRSQALAMGATYQPDWNSDSTLLICAFPNTPKFRQVESNSGTIVSKDWIAECYTQKKLVDIEQYLLHAGKPWRKTSAPKNTTIRSENHQILDKLNKASDSNDLVLQENVILKEENLELRQVITSMKKLGGAEGGSTSFHERYCSSSLDHDLDQDFSCITNDPKTHHPS